MTKWKRFGRMALVHSFGGMRNTSQLCGLLHGELSQSRWWLASELITASPNILSWDTFSINLRYGHCSKVHTSYATPLPSQLFREKAAGSYLDQGQTSACPYKASQLACDCRNQQTCRGRGTDRQKMSTWVLFIDDGKALDPKKGI